MSPTEREQYVQKYFIPSSTKYHRFMNHIDRPVRKQEGIDIQYQSDSMQQQ